MRSVETEGTALKPAESKSPSASYADSSPNGGASEGEAPGTTPSPPLGERVGVRGLLTQQSAAPRRKPPHLTSPLKRGEEPDAPTPTTRSSPLGGGGARSATEGDYSQASKVKAPLSQLR